MQRTSLVVLVLVGLVAFAGCNAFSGRSDTASETPPVTPMDVPTELYDCKQTTDGKPTLSRAPADDNNGGPDRLVIGEHATWVTTPSSNGQNSHREYIALRYLPIGEAGPQPLNLSGYTVTYGSGPTYTIPENVRFGPQSGGEVYIWTGQGENRAYGEWAASIRSQYVLHASHDAPLIAQDGTTITIRNRSGKIVSQKTVTPINGTVPFVPTVNATEFMNESVDTIEEAKNATPFALRAPTNVPEGYQLQGLTIGYITGNIYGYALFYSREPNNHSDDFIVNVIAPRSVNEDDRPGRSHPVTVGDQTGCYATHDTGDDKRGLLQFIGPDGWMYFLNGPAGEQRLIKIGESIEVVEGNATK